MIFPYFCAGTLPLSAPWLCWTKPELKIVGQVETQPTIFTLEDCHDSAAIDVSRDPVHPKVR